MNMNVNMNNANVNQQRGEKRQVEEYQGIDENQKRNQIGENNQGGIQNNNIIEQHLGNQNYIVSSSPNDYIKIWNFETGKFIRDIGSKADHTYFINYWRNNDKYYIIDANADSVKIYGIEKENQLYGEYSGTERTWHMHAFVERINDVDTLFESDGKGDVRLWNLETHKMILCIHCQHVSLRGLVLWNQKYILAASSDKSFKILDLEKGELVLSVSGQHVNSICTLKKIVHPIYGEALLTGSIDGNIKLWVNNGLISQ